MQICDHCGAIANDDEVLVHWFPCETNEQAFWDVFYQDVPESDPEEEEEEGGE